MNCQKDDIREALASPQESAATCRTDIVGEALEWEELEPVIAPGLTPNHNETFLTIAE